MDSLNGRREKKLQRARSARAWKIVAGASAAAAISVVLATSLHDRSARGDHVDPAPDSKWTALIFMTLTAAPSEEVVKAASSAPPPPPATIVTSPTTTTTSATVDVRDDAAVRPALVPIAAAPAVIPVDMPGDAGAMDHAATARPADTTSPSDTATAAADAGRPQPQNLWAPPSMSAGASPFVTDAPYWAASAFVSDPNAGAGRFTTEAPPWAASAFISDPNAGAGPFTTELNIPAWGAVWW